MTYTQEKRITQKTVKDMGFTDKLIAELLPEPQLVNNPYYRKAAKMKLWKLSDVEDAMNNPVFQESFKKRKKYKEAAEKGVATKKAHLKDETDKFLESIKIEHLDIGLIREYALKAKQNWYDDKFCMRSNVDYKTTDNADEDTVTRWTVNYIRHQMTTYDEQLYHMKGRVGKNDMYREIHNHILDKIANVYPELAEECEQQKIWGECLID